MQIPNTRRITNSPMYSNPCQSQSEIQYSYPPLELSLKPLITFEPQQNPSLSRSCSSTSIDTMVSDLFSPTSSSSSSSSLLMSGDYIGMESCVDVLSDDELSFGHRHRGCYSQRKEKLCWAQEKEKKRTYEELPPPIPLLARTENLTSHMPWVLKRHYTTDGRLILTEEKVRHHEYFRAHRSNGRLRLQLVPLDGQALVPPIICCNDEHEDEEVDDHDGYCSEYEDHVFYDDDLAAYDGDYDYDYDYDDDRDSDGTSVDGCHHHGDAEQIFDAVSSTTGLAGKCLNINAVRTRSCNLGVRVPAIRCVKTNTNGSRKVFLGQAAGFGGLFRGHAGRVMISAFCEPVGISFTHRVKLAACIFAIITAWEKGWSLYGWKQILSWSYFFSLNPFLLVGLCVLSGYIVVT